MKRLLRCLSQVRGPRLGAARLLRLAATSLPVMALGLAIGSAAAHAERVCQNKVCIEFLNTSDPKRAQFKVVGTYLSSSRFNLRQGSSQHEISVGHVVTVPRSRDFALQHCRRPAISLSSTCDPWASFTPPSVGQAGKSGKDKWDRRVQIINGTSTVVERFFATNTKTNSWGSDRFGKRVLQPGASLTLNIDDGTGACQFDFRAVLATGRKVEMRGIDVCHIRSWTVR